MVNVLTWNICWSCMSTDKHNNIKRTYQSLANYCSKLADKKKTNVCLNNVANYIKDGNYDLIGLQEAKNCIDIYKIINHSNNYGFIYNNIKHPIYDIQVDIVTFYNINKFRPLAINSGNLLPDKGRPYQIIFFEKIKTKSIYIFINLHNGHNVPLNYLEKALSHNFDNFINIQKEKNYQDNNKNKYTKFDLMKINYDNIKIIMVGDFNDRNDFKYWNGIKPFYYTKINRLKNIILTSKNKQPPNSCCDSNQKNKMIFPYCGDYILINETLTYYKNNYISNKFIKNSIKNPTSDHAPISAIITSKKSLHLSQQKNIV